MSLHGILKRSVQHGRSAHHGQANQPDVLPGAMVPANGRTQHVAGILHEQLAKARRRGGCRRSRVGGERGFERFQLCA